MRESRAVFLELLWKLCLAATKARAKSCRKAKIFSWEWCWAQLLASDDPKQAVSFKMNRCARVYFRAPQGHKLRCLIVAEGALCAFSAFCLALLFSRHIQTRLFQSELALGFGPGGAPLLPRSADAPEIGFTVHYSDSMQGCQHVPA